MEIKELAELLQEENKNKTSISQVMNNVVSGLKSRNCVIKSSDNDNDSGEVYFTDTDEDDCILYVTVDSDGTVIKGVYDYEEIDGVILAI